MVLEHTHLYYLMSFACNERCTKCHHWQRPVDRPLDTATVASAFEDLPRLHEFCIVGGEPLVWKDAVLGLLAAASGYDFRTVVITNGVRLDSQFVAAAAKGNVHIVVSIDTVDPLVWRWVRGRDTCSLVLANVRQAREHLDPTQLSIQSVRAKETEPHLPGVRAFCAELGVHHSVQNFIAEGFEGEWTPVDEGGGLNSVAHPCIAANRNVSLMPNGDVYTCFQQSWIPDCGAPLGNIRQQRLGDLLRTAYAASVTRAMTRCDLPCRVLKCNQPA